MHYDLETLLILLQPHYKNIRLTTTLPRQLIIYMEQYTILIFTSGQCRLMGRLHLEEAQSAIQSLNTIYSCIESPLQPVSETVVFKLDSLHAPINLYKFACEFPNDNRIQFEPELFPALCLHFWKPLHVNVFTTGKVIILGHNASASFAIIRDWLNFQLLL